MQVINLDLIQVVKENEQYQTEINKLCQQLTDNAVSNTSKTGRISYGDLIFWNARITTLMDGCKSAQEQLKEATLKQVFRKHPEAADGTRFIHNGVGFKVQTTKDYNYLDNDIEEEVIVNGQVVRRKKLKALLDEQKALKTRQEQLTRQIKGVKAEILSIHKQMRPTEVKRTLQYL